jgi:hypothetical protein
MFTATIVHYLAMSDFYTSRSRQNYQELVGLVVLGETRVDPGLRLCAYSTPQPGHPQVHERRWTLSYSLYTSSLDAESFSIHLFVAAVMSVMSNTRVVGSATFTLLLRI